MTTTSYDARLARLNAATKGDTVTVPDGWAKPDVEEPRRYAADADLRPGDVFTNDGDDVLEWRLGSAALGRAGNQLWYDAADLAELGLTPDDLTTPDDEPIVTDTVPDGGAIAGDFSDETWGSAPADDDEDGDPVIGTVTVKVVPDTDGFVEAVEKVAREAADVADASGFHLDDFQRERVAALEHALRILEARRGKRRPATGLMSTIGTTASTGEVVPARDLVTVAGFIADGEVRA